jgi:glycosyltransferase involved in cell wall biosynthesis
MSECPITILMPVKNCHEEFLRRALASATSQHDPDWRLLVVVEVGERSSLPNALASADEDRRINIITNEGRNLAGALNTGMRRAETDFVALLLADDMWSPDAVGTLKRYISRYRDADFFHSSRMIIDEHDAPISRVYYSKKTVRLSDFKWSTPVKHLLCWRRAKALSFGGMDESVLIGPDDFDFPWTMAEQGASFMAIKECLYLYRDHRESYRLTTHLPLSIHERDLRSTMKKHGLSAALIAARVAFAKRSYLQQAIYRTAFDKWIKERLGYDARRGWRERYR